MNRLDYTNRLRRAGFTVRPGWQARSADAETPTGYDLTAYAVYGADGSYLINIIVRQLDHGVEVYFASTNNMVEANIAQLQRLAREQAA